jgi:hypothetical protein
MGRDLRLGEAGIIFSTSRELFAAGSSNQERDSLAFPELPGYSHRKT